MAHESKIDVVGICEGVRTGAGRGRRGGAAGPGATVGAAAAGAGAGNGGGCGAGTATVDLAGEMRVRVAERELGSRSSTTSRMISEPMVRDCVANPIESAWKHRLLMFRGMPLLTRQIM